ncbi:penicillin-binding protein activator [uncultured Roseobacter sp.]|uniref:penicillin-binding protein activator n=1 Tax=uncultured Roseobacter sp. TaxID=114847 RepID=UPI00262E8BA1|nr:penicillin-binding protein activator [uncultured Roseobacter sp.]
MHASYSRRRFLSRLTALGAVPLLGACAQTTAPRSAPTIQPARTALLLPLSGPKADLGQTMAKAVWLVEDSRGLPQRVEIFDTGPTPQGAVAAANRAEGAGAEVVIGPLFSDHTAAVMASPPKAQVVTLSNDDRLAATGAWVFGVTPAHSAIAAAGFARKNGWDSIALMQPGGDFGAQSATALAAAAKTHRLKLMPPVPMAASDDVLERLKEAGGGQLPDSLYLPSADGKSRRAAQIAEQAGLSVIGSLQWADVPTSDLAPLKTLQFAGPDPRIFNSLSSSYQSQLGEEMGILSGLAVDAVMFANTLPRDRNGRVQMTGMPPREGLLGQCSFRKDRTCARQLAILQLRDGQVSKVA